MHAWEKEAEESQGECGCSQGPQGRWWEAGWEVYGWWKGRAPWDGEQSGSLTVGGRMPLEVNSCEMRLCMALPGCFKKVLEGIGFRVCVQTEEEMSIRPGVISGGPESAE